MATADGVIGVTSAPLAMSLYYHKFYNTQLTGFNKRFRGNSDAFDMMLILNDSEWLSDISVILKRALCKFSKQITRLFKQTTLELFRKSSLQYVYMDLTVGRSGNEVVNDVNCKIKHLRKCIAHMHTFSVSLDIFPSVLWSFATFRITLVIS